MISAAVVGLLGLGANLFIKHTSNRTGSVASQPAEQTTEHAVDDVTDQELAEIPPAEKTPKDYARELQRIEKKLSPIYKLWKKNRNVSQQDWSAFESTAARAEELNQLIQSDPRNRPKFKRRAQLFTLSITFKIARVDQRQTEPFMNVSNSIITGTKIKPDIARAAGLQLVLMNDLQNPDQPLLIRSLTRFSEEYESVQAGVDVYALVAKELNFNGHKELAQIILRLGLRKYDGRPVHQLIQLLDENVR